MSNHLNNKRNRMRRVMVLMFVFSSVLVAMEEKSKSRLTKAKYYFRENGDWETDAEFEARIKKASNFESFSLKINNINFLLSVNDNLDAKTRTFTIKRAKIKKKKKEDILWEKVCDNSERVPNIGRFSLSPDLLKIIMHGYYKYKDENESFFSFISIYDRLSDKEINGYTHANIIASAITSDGKYAALLKEKYIQGSSTREQETKHSVYLMDTASSKTTQEKELFSGLNISLTIFNGLLVMGFNKQGTKVRVHIPKTERYSEINQEYAVSDFIVEGAF